MSSVQHSDQVKLLYKTISLICQTLFYGIYAALIPFSSYFLLRKKTMTKANKIMFGMTIFMFLLSTVFWTASVANLIATLNIFYASSPEQSSEWFMLFPLFNALLLVNYVLTDSVVVWRASVLCKDGMSVLAFIGIRVTMAVSGRNLNQIDISQMTNLVLSLLTNVFATSIIAYRACWDPGSTVNRSEKLYQRNAIQARTLYSVDGRPFMSSVAIDYSSHCFGDTSSLRELLETSIRPFMFKSLACTQQLSWFS
ncbi:hypothetical protein ACEPAF_8322 [Sanghuangporus sanghuang]